MKILLFSFCLFTGVFVVTAQQASPGKNRYQQVSGRYGGNEGICLFDDSTFLLYGYATAIFGHYRFEQDQLFFTPDKPELFEVYAAYNKSIEGRTKINFMNFEGNGRTFLQLDKDSLKQVFNDGANCFDAPFVAEENRIPETLTLSAEESDYRPPLAANTYRYENKGHYNDFMIVYYPAKREYEPFSASFHKKGTEVALMLSNFATEKGYRKHEADEDEQRQWREILEMKTRYGVEEKMKRESVYANEHYNTFSVDMEAYDFDAASNLYVSKNAADNEDYFKQNSYSDDRYLRRFVPLLPKTKSKLDTAKLHQANASIFYTVCGEGAENSYHYKALDTEYEDNDTVPETIVPVPLEPAKP